MKIFDFERGLDFILLAWFILRIHILFLIFLLWYFLLALFFTVSLVIFTVMSGCYLIQDLVNIYGINEAGLDFIELC